MEYARFNNVETKPGIGYPKAREDQEKWKGGWIRKINGKLEPRLGGKAGVMAKIFANPEVPGIDDYYEPFSFDYQHLHNAPEGKYQPTARPRSLISGQRMKRLSGAQTGRRFWAANSACARRTATLSPCRRRCTASLKTPL